MQNKGRILAIDYGEKRVGLALSDADQIIAFPRQTLSNDESLFVRIK
ncbi:Holliday junction resolvase RuvX, partial [Candidatus Peregrinibacteria bacterium CG11_big_fil_rev_8_21_14_0_20_41_10]